MSLTALETADGTSTTLALKKKYAGPNSSRRFTPSPTRSRSPIRRYRSPSPHRRSSQSPGHDIIVFSETFEDHLIRLRLVLKCLQEAGLKLNSKKCLFAAQEVKILGHLVSTEVAEIAKFLLEEIVLRHGAPRVIITDRGAVFRSRLVPLVDDLCNIDHRFTTAYHPQTNGLTERFNKTLADMLSMYVDVEQKNWDEILPFVTFAYNTAKQRDFTGFTPFYLLHGREAETTLDTMLPFSPNDFDDNNITKIAARAEESRQLARVHTLRAQDKDRRRYDSKHQMVSYAPGDLVWIYTPVRKSLSRKLFKKVFRPYQECYAVYQP
ncbi:transposon Ty3-I Gag-Pol polyprotein [Trichonephila clavipes]|nr:transposon Ty3-I Gag-Pol polyprotein [Trichonephila clavipes]